jgi:hypothetical protein
MALPSFSDDLEALAGILYDLGPTAWIPREEFIMDFGWVCYRQHMSAHLPGVRDGTTNYLDIAIRYLEHGRMLYRDDLLVDLGGLDCSPRKFSRRDWDILAGAKPRLADHVFHFFNGSSREILLDRAWFADEYLALAQERYALLPENVVPLAWGGAAKRHQR